MHVKPQCHAGTHDVIDLFVDVKAMAAFYNHNRNNSSITSRNTN
jgi:hypothetical protein